MRVVLCLTMHYAGEVSVTVIPFLRREGYPSSPAEPE